MDKPTCLNCQSPIEIPSTGRPPKFCKTACRVSFSRKNKIKTLPTTDPATPSDHTQPPSHQPLIGSNGVDYSDPYKVLPPQIAVYMPIQSHQSHADLTTLEKAIHGHQPLKSTRPPTF